MFDFTIIPGNGTHTWMELSLVQSHLHREEFTAYSAIYANHNPVYLILPITHSCWMDRRSMEWEVYPVILLMMALDIKP